MLNVLS